MNRCVFSVIALSVAVAAGNANAQIWAEQGPLFGSPPSPDADQLPATANHTLGVGPLTQITGFNLNGSDRDLYCITITDASHFSATMTPSLAARNASMALFDANGYGVAANYDTGPANSNPDRNPALSNIPGLTNGTYYLLVYGTVFYPTDGDGYIFNPPTAGFNQTGLILPNAGSGPLSDYGLDFGAGFGGSNLQNTYVVDLTGCGYCEAPAPGAAALLGVAGLGFMRRRR